MVFALIPLFWVEMIPRSRASTDSGVSKIAAEPSRFGTAWPRSRFETRLKIHETAQGPRRPALNRHVLCQTPPIHSDAAESTPVCFGLRGVEEVGEGIVARQAIFKRNESA